MFTQRAAKVFALGLVQSIGVQAADLDAQGLAQGLDVLPAGRAPLAALPGDMGPRLEAPLQAAQPAAGRARRDLGLMRLSPQKGPQVAGFEAKSLINCVKALSLYCKSAEVNAACMYFKNASNWKNTTI